MKIANKFGCYEQKPGRWLVYFTHEGQQVHLTKRIDGASLTNKTDCDLLVAYLLRVGYKPERWGHKDRAFRFDIMANTWVKLTTKDTERMKERERFVRLIFIPFFGRKDVREISTADIDQFITHLQDKDFQPLYIRNLLVDLKAFFKFNKKIIPDPPEFRKIEAQEKLIKWLDSKEQDEVFLFIAKKHLPIFTFLRSYGCRLNEACGLLWDNVNLNKGYLAISHVIGRDRKLKPFTKKKQLKIAPIFREVEWIFNQNGSSYVFMNGKRNYTSWTLNYLWKEASRKANEKYGTPVVNVYCGLRHSFATQRLNQGFTLDEVSKALGHANVQTTKRYGAYTLEKLLPVYKGDINPRIHNLLEYKGNLHDKQFQQNCGDPRAESYGS